MTYGTDLSGSVVLLLPSGKQMWSGTGEGSLSNGLFSLEHVTCFFSFNFWIVIGRVIPHKLALMSMSSDSIVNFAVCISVGKNIGKKNTDKSSPLLTTSMEIVKFTRLLPGCSFIIGAM